MASREKRLLKIITAAILGAGWSVAGAGVWAEGEPQIWDKIVFVTRRDVNRNFEVYLMDLDGSNQTNLTNNPASDWEPAVSPDGKKIAFTSDRAGFSEIYLMDVDGGNVTRLTRNDINDMSPAFSPDGEQIVFCSVLGMGDIEIFKIDIDGTDLERLTDNDFIEINPHYSPDGRTVIFTVDWTEDNNCEIFTFDFESRETRRLTYGQEVDLSHGYTGRIGSGNPVYFPGGQKIAFWSSDMYEDGVYIMNADATGRERLNNGGHNPSVSPDGKRIAFDRGYLQTEEIYLVNVDGSEETRLTVNNVPDSDPSFAPMLIDGRLLDYYGHWHDIDH